MKVCSKCLEEKSVEEFSFNSTQKGYRQSMCKECCSRWRDQNRGLLKERDREGREEKRGYCVVKYTEEYEKVYQQEYYKRKRNLPKNKEVITKYQAEYNKVNRESRTAKRKERLQEDPLFKLSTGLRSNIGAAFIRGSRGAFTKGKGDVTLQILGCSFKDFASYIIAQFTEGMSLENYGEWHLDHITPLATAKTREDVVRLNHYTNFQPLWAKDNFSKGSKIIKK
tara:strand:- start:439 stop:1113 length:675 start_codon:yes stop_codon:yes gene_type:complete